MPAELPGQGGEQPDAQLDFILTPKEYGEIIQGAYGRYRRNVERVLDDPNLSDEDKMACLHDLEVKGLSRRQKSLKARESVDATAGMTIPYDFEREASKPKLFGRQWLEAKTRVQQNVLASGAAITGLAGVDMVLEHSVGEQSHHLPAGLAVAGLGVMACSSVVSKTWYATKRIFREKRKSRS